MQNNSNEKLYLKIYTRRGIIMNEEVTSVSSTNDTGYFDVLREHAQFISKIKKSLDIVKLDGTGVSVPVGDAIMRVKGNYVEVFLGIKSV